MLTIPNAMGEKKVEKRAFNKFVAVIKIILMIL